MISDDTVSSTTVDPGDDEPPDPRPAAPTENNEAIAAPQLPEPEEDPEPEPPVPAVPAAVRQPAVPAAAPQPPVPPAAAARQPSVPAAPSQPPAQAAVRQPAVPTAAPQPPVPPPAPQPPVQVAAATREPAVPAALEPPILVPAAAPEPPVPAAARQPLVRAVAFRPPVRAAARQPLVRAATPQRRIVPATARTPLVVPPAAPAARPVLRLRIPPAANYTIPINENSGPNRISDNNRGPQRILPIRHIWPPDRPLVVDSESEEDDEYLEDLRQKELAEERGEQISPKRTRRVNNRPFRDITERIMRIPVETQEMAVEILGRTLHVPFVIEVEPCDAPLDQEHAERLIDACLDIPNYICDFQPIQRVIYDKAQRNPPMNDTHTIEMKFMPKNPNHGCEGTCRGRKFYCLTTLSDFRSSMQKVSRDCGCEIVLKPDIADKYTLVTGFHGTIGRFTGPIDKTNSRPYEYRPYFHWFIKVVQRFFDVMLYLDGPEKDCAQLVDELTEHRVIHIVIDNKDWSEDRVTIKRIDRLFVNRNSTVVLDSDPRTAVYNLNNLIPIKPYCGEIDDRELLVVLPYLVEMVHKKFNVRRYLSRLGAWRRLRPPDEE